jgi:hypothetical protein
METASPAPAAVSRRLVQPRGAIAAPLSDVPTAEDIAFGFPYGPARGDGQGLSSSLGPDPLAALEATILPQIERGRCYVSFSGGLDSSLILSVATSLARRIGAEDPVALTWRFDETAARAQESHWQEAVIAELGLSDWHRLQAGDSLDWTGPVAAGVLRRHGLLYPANTFLHAPLAEIAAGGTLLTGIGGDQILGLWRGREVMAVLAGRRWPTARDTRRLGIAALPPALRTELGSRLRPSQRLGWLTAAAQSRLHRAAAARFGEPTRWDRHLHWRRSRRDTALTLASVAALTSSSGATVSAPLLDPSVVSALARAGGRWGAGDREQTLSRWFPGAVPAAVRDRRDKAVFGQVFWREPSRRFARDLATSGELMNSDLISAQGLAEEWLSPSPSNRTPLLLQQYWLSRDQNRVSPGSAAAGRPPG